MSRAYRIVVKGLVERVVHVDDGVCTSLELLPILAKDRMRQHLGRELARRGFVDARTGTQADEARVLRRGAGDGVVVEVALDGGTVTVRVDADASVDVHGERVKFLGIKSSTRKIDATRRLLQEGLDAKLEAAAAAEVEAARQKATERLEAKLADLKEELDGVVNRVTAEALKEKARQMGEIEEIIEDEKTGALTIKVKL